VKLFNAGGDSNSQKLREREIREGFVCLFVRREKGRKERHESFDKKQRAFGLRAFSHCLGHVMHTRTITRYGSSKRRRPIFSEFSKNKWLLSS